MQLKSCAAFGVERKHNMSMQSGNCSLGLNREPSRHAQLDHKAVFIVEREDDPLAPPVNPLDLPAQKAARHVDACRANIILSHYIDVKYFRPGHLGFKCGNDGLHFW